VELNHRNKPDPTPTTLQAMRSFVVALLAMAAAVSARKKVVLQSGLSAESNAERWHAVRSSEGAWTAVRDSDLADKAASAAWAELDNKVTEEGWAYLRVTTNPTFSDTEQAYAAGYIEGNVTAGMIAQVRGVLRG
jgi:Phospholipase B